jgi:hypothetical protein
VSHRLDRYFVGAGSLQADDSQWPRARSDHALPALGPLDALGSRRRLHEASSGRAGALEAKPGHTVGTADLVPRSTCALEQALRRYVAQANADAKPFIWSKTADEILESVARFCRRISNSAH